jgi:signal transduction histidine kinase
MIFACGLVVLFSAAWGSWTWTHERQMLRQRLDDAGSVLVSSMAIPMINALLYEELGLVSVGGLLDNFIVDIMNNPQLKPVYALVTDPKGKILAHSQINQFGQHLDDELTKSALAATSVIIRQQTWQGQKVLDVGSPLAIHGKRWGCLRVGFPLAPLQAQLKSLAMRIASFSAIFAFGALLLFFIAGSRLVKPLRNLAKEMERVDGEKLAKIPLSPRRDELGLLQNSFSQMLKRLRKSEHERDESVKQLLENERLVTTGRIVAGVTHEINNPLAGISGALSVLKRKPQALDQYLPLLQDEVERITGIVSQLLGLSRTGELNRESVDAENLLHEIKRICQLATKGKAIDLHFSESAPRATITCDARKIQQVVLNLVINAADAMDDCGQIKLYTYQDDDDFCIQVKDNGPGVPDKLKEQIFTPFFTTKAAGKGTGIGLAFSAHTIENHGGSLSLLETDSGACFEIRIPLGDQDNHGQ